MLNSIGIQDQTGAATRGGRSADLDVRYGHLASGTHLVAEQNASTWWFPVTGIGQRFILIGAALVALIFGVAGLWIVNQRAAELIEAQHANDNLAQVLAEQTSRSIQAVDLTIREILGRLAAAMAKNPGDPTEWSSKAAFDLLVERLKSLPQVSALMVVGPSGSMLNFSHAFPAAPMDASHRDYFEYLSTHDDHSLFVSAPAKSFWNGSWIVLLSRRINDANGAFAGTVVASVTVSYLEDFYRAVTPENGAVTVLRHDGVILLGYPSIDASIGAKMQVDTPWYRLVAAGGGPYRSPGTSSDAARLVSVHPLRDFPLVINVSTRRDTALYGWHRQTFWVLLGAGVASVCVIVLLRAFSTQYSRLTGQNQLLETGRQRFNAVLDNMSQGLTFFDRDQKLLVCNRRYVELYKLTPQQTRPGTSLSDIVAHRLAQGSVPDMTLADYLARRLALTSAAEAFDITDEFRDGRVVLMHYEPLAGGGWVTTHEDITERRKAEASLAFMAHHDPLTKLPNRTLFLERLTQAIGLADRGLGCALLCLNLDRFKVINDTLGHPIGDGLLCAVAARLAGVVRKVDTLARLGGDEFAIIQTGLNVPEAAVKLANRIIAAMGRPFDINGHRITAAISLGISLAPQDGATPDTLLQKADIALYQAKTEGRGTFRFFKPDIDSPLERSRIVELELRNASLEDDFELHYQPILDLQTGGVTGFEALIRWNHPVRGLISPAEFIPVAEESGRIIAIGEWALRTACQEAALWPSDIELAVNLSPIQFKDANLLTAVNEALTKSGLSSSRLELEITESVLVQNSAATLDLLHQLKAMGIRIALDDFGTGYSSLSYLRSFPFDKIKIDRSFIRDIETNSGSSVIVGAAVAIARGLGMITVAEGVETAQQLVKIREQGCTKVQGYLFSRPRPAADVPGLIRTLRGAARELPATGDMTNAARPDPTARTRLAPDDAAIHHGKEPDSLIAL